MIGLQSLQFSTWGEWASRTWSTGPVLQWSIFQGGQVRANIALQTARQEEAWISYQKTVLAAFQEAERSLSSFDQEQRKRKRLADAVNANTKAVQLASDRYRQGVEDFLSVLDAQRSLFLSQSALVRSDRAISENLVALFKALGGGWESRIPEETGSGPGDAHR
jgi:outer membrane protein TolC